MEITVFKANVIEIYYVNYSNLQETLSVTSDIYAQLLTVVNKTNIGLPFSGLTLPTNSNVISDEHS